MSKNSTGTMLDIRIDGAIAYVTMNRPGKRNALCDDLVSEIENFFTAPPKDVKVVILSAMPKAPCGTRATGTGSWK